MPSPPLTAERKGDVQGEEEAGARHAQRDLGPDLQRVAQQLLSLLQVVLGGHEGRPIGACLLLRWLRDVHAVSAASFNGDVCRGL